jgi:predicted nucleic acid-binding protein
VIVLDASAVIAALVASPRNVDLREGISGAASLALAEALSAPLVTCDRKLAARGHAAAVEVLA